MQREVFDRMEEIDGHHWWFVGRRCIVRELVKEFGAGNKTLRILEVGCGTGSNLPMLKEFGSVDAIEPDEAAREVASRRSGIRVRGGEVPGNIDLNEGEYDLIVLLDVLEHIGDDVGALSLLKSKLAPGGKILLTVPAVPWLWSSHDVAHHHHRRYTRSRLTDALDQSGFELVHNAHFNSILFPLIATMRLIGRIMGREGGDDAVPSRFINRLLTKIFAFERRWVARASMPFGVSLAAVARARPA